MKEPIMTDSEKLDLILANQAAMNETLNGIVQIVEAVVGQLANHPMLKAFMQ
jgi:hypothetical protein